MKVGFGKGVVRALFAGAVSALLFGASAGQAQEVLQGAAEAVDQPAADTPVTAPARRSLIDEIVVTAQKREEAAQDVGIAISAFSDEVLDALGITDTTELTNLVPGFTYTDSGVGIPIYTLRGVGFNDNSHSATSAVGVYLDEVNIPFPVMTKGASLDVERVEVLKGPQGTLYGRNTTGGAVNYVAKKPGEEFEAGVSVGYERFQHTDVEGFISAPVSDDFGIRIAARNIRSFKGWQYDYTRPDDELGIVDRQSGRIVAVWEPTERITLNGMAQLWRDRSDSQSAQYHLRKVFAPLPASEPSEAVQNHPTAPDDDARATAFNPDTDYKLDQLYYGASLRADWELTDAISMTAIGSFQDFTADDSYNNDGMNVADLEYSPSTDISAWNAELRFTGTAFEDRVHWVAGYFHSSDELSDIRRSNTTESSAGYGGILFREIELFAEQDAKSDAFFGQAEWQAFEKIKFTAGIRYTRDSRTYAACTRDLDGTTAAAFQAIGALQRAGLGDLVSLLTTDQANQIGQVISGLLPVTALSGVIGDAIVAAANAGVLDLTGGLSGGPGVGDCVTLDSQGNSGLVEGELKESNIAYRLAIDWTPTEQALVYGSYSVGYKAGSYPTLLSATDEQYKPVTQERIEAFEIGLKSEWYGGMLRVNTSLFHYNYEDKQLFTIYRDPIFGPIQRLDNVPESVVQGWELEIQAAPVEGLFLSIGSALLRTEVTDYLGTTNEGEQNVDFSGNQLDYASPFELTAIINYEWPMFQDFFASVGFDGKYSYEAYADLSNDERIKRDSYFVMNARLGFRPAQGAWNLQVFVKNLTDKVYYNSLQSQVDGFVRFAGKPRTYGFRADYTF